MRVTLHWSAGAHLPRLRLADRASYKRSKTDQYDAEVGTRPGTGGRAGGRFYWGDFGLVRSARPPASTRPACA